MNDKRISSDKSVVFHKTANSVSLFRKNFGKGLFFLLVLCGGWLCASCSKDNDDNGYVYPSLLTELADLKTDEKGYGMQFTTDGGTTYRLSSPLQGLQPNAFYRIICSYALTGEISDAYPVAKIYTAESVNLLKLTEENAEADDPTAVTSIWIGGKYLNMQLTPKTQGGTQSWGYRVDYVGRTSSGKAYYHLSLYHRQPNDPYSYSTTVYASLPLTDVDSIQKGDSIAFTVLTFSGRKTWRFSFD